VSLPLVGKISPLGHSKKTKLQKDISKVVRQKHKGFSVPCRTEDLLNPHRRTAGGEALYNPTMPIGIVGD